MRQRLGQHFLKNKEKIRKIIKTLEIKDGDTIVEIGPGHGELTEFLVEKFLAFSGRGELIAIERDKNLAVQLKTKFQNPNIRIIEGDVLKTLFQIPKALHLMPNAYKIIGNVPYYITGRLLRILSEIEPKPKFCVFTLQKEVAERICAKPQKMNLLAASTQFWADPEIVDIISKKDFKPRPAVDGAIIKLRFKNYAAFGEPRLWRESRIKENYYKLIKILFKQPRKTILNNLIALDKSRRSYYKVLLEKNGINPQHRPQNLSVEKLKKLAELLYN